MLSFLTFRGVDVTSDVKSVRVSKSFVACLCTVDW